MEHRKDINKGEKNMNSINLIGNICQDVELRQTNNGKSVVSFNLAVNRPFAKDTTDFIPLVVYGQPAEYISRYASKGSKIAVSGKLTTRNYEDKNGNKRTAFEVVADSAEICESARENTTEANSQPYMTIGYTSNNQDFEEIPTDETLPL
jgi:single-strand DNA-binding protein